MLLTTITIKRDNFISFLLGLMLFVFSTGVLSSYFLILWGILVVFKYYKGLKIDSVFNLMIIVIALSLVNEAIAIYFRKIEVEDWFLLIPYSILILFTMYISKIIDDNNIFKWFVFFVLIEILIGIVQLLLGKVSFYDPSLLIIDDNLLYNKKVFGLCANSSGFAYHILLALLIYHKNKDCRIIQPLYFYSLIIIGFVISFNRTAILSVLIFTALNYFRNNYKYKWLILLIVIATLFFVLNNQYYIDYITYQFFRGDVDRNTVNALSERDIVYPFYWNFIKENLLLGNGSLKYTAEIMNDGRIFHAHNSYLQTIANNGIIISSIIFYIIISKINKSNYVYILVFLFTSFFQAFILWGISLNDIIFYRFLFDVWDNKNSHSLKTNI